MCREENKQKRKRHEKEWNSLRGAAAVCLTLTFGFLVENPRYHPAITHKHEWVRLSSKHRVTEERKTIMSQQLFHNLQHLALQKRSKAMDASQNKKNYSEREVWNSTSHWKIVCSATVLGPAFTFFRQKSAKECWDEALVHWQNFIFIFAHNRVHISHY